MSGTYKLISLVGTSDLSFAEAVDNAIRDASRTVRGIAWFEVDELRGRVADGKVDQYQVTLRAGFRVEAAEGGQDRVRRAKRGRK